MKSRIIYDILPGRTTESASGSGSIVHRGFKTMSALCVSLLCVPEQLRQFKVRITHVAHTQVH